LNRSLPILATFCAALLALAIALPMGARAVTSATAPQVIKAGTFADNRPWAFRGADGHLTGFDVDLARAVATRLGAGIDFQTMPFRDLFPALAAGRIDLALCSITVTPERLKAFDFTQPYYETAQGVVVLKGSHFRSLADLGGRRVSTAAGTTNEEWLHANSARYALGAIVPVEGLEDGLALLQNHGADAYFGDLPALLYSLLQRPDLAVVERLKADERYAVALPHGSALTQRVDGALAALKEDGTLAAIHRRWFGAAPPAGSPVMTVLPRP
jgi:polar amino acid transport system substrate-binding protein